MSQPYFFRSVIGLTALGMGTAATCYAVEAAEVYLVKRGDTLSGIAQKMLPGHVYGNGGTLARLLNWNSSQIKNPDRIYPGQELALGPSEQAPLARASGGQDSSRAPASSEPPTFAQPEGGASHPPVTEWNSFSLSPYFSQSRINSTDLSTGGQSVLGSSMNVGLSGAWEQHWSSRFETAAFIHLERDAYQTTGTATLDNANPLLGDFGIEAKSYFTSLEDLGPSVSVKLSLEVETFVRAVSLTELSLDTVSVPELSASYFQPIYHSQIYLLGVEGFGGILSPTSTGYYSVKLGYAYGGALSISEPHAHTPLQGSLFFVGQSQNTSITSQSTDAVGVQLSIGFGGRSSNSTSGQEPKP